MFLSSRRARSSCSMTTRWRSNWLARCYTNTAIILTARSDGKLNHWTKPSAGKSSTLDYAIADDTMRCSAHSALGNSSGSTSLWTSAAFVICTATVAAFRLSRASRRGTATIFLSSSKLLEQFPNTNLPWRERQARLPNSKRVPRRKPPRVHSTRSRLVSGSALFSKWILPKRFTFLSCVPVLQAIFPIATLLTKCSRKSRKNILRWRNTSAYKTSINPLICCKGKPRPTKTNNGARRALARVSNGVEQLRSKNFEMNRQVLLRILPDSFDQLLGIRQKFVRVVIH